MANASSRVFTPIFALFLAALMLFAACAPATPSTDGGNNNIDVSGTFEQPAAFDPDHELDAIAFQSEDEFRAFIRAGADGYNSNVLYAARDSVGGSVAMGVPAPAMAPSGMKAESDMATRESSGGSGNSYSGTESQIENVDEADIIKTDGEYVYTTTGRTLFLIRAYPGAEAEVVGTVALDMDPNGLFIDGDKLAVIGNYYDADYFAEKGIRPRNGMTRVTIYDVSDRADAKVLETYTLEGSYQAARMKDGVVYVTLTSGPDGRTEYPTPLIIRGDTVSSVPVKDAYWFPMPYQYVQFVTAHAIGLRDTNRAIDSVTVAVEGTGTVFMSENAIYLAATEWINEWEVRQEILRDMVAPKLGDADTTLISKIKATDSDVLSEPEKQAKIDQIYNEYVNYLPSEAQQDLNDAIDTELKKRMDKLESLEWTIINRIDVESDGSLSVGPTGKVPGSVYGQFAMDEHEGYLRVATTVNQRWNSWWRPMPIDARASAVEGDVMIDSSAKMIAPQEPTQSTNNVYVLDGDLKVVGSVTGIAKGETIQSARFIGDRLYLVTFRQVDPFFAIDLSNPEKPKILGELKVPGFSRYLHPYDDNIVIGIGRDVSDTGRQQGLKISLFDVTDVSKPKEIAKWVAADEQAQSVAEWEHKAFLFDREKELLVIPGYSYDYGWNTGNKASGFNGAMVFSITPSSIKMRGIIDHGVNNGMYGATVERSLYIENLLYTKSPTLLRINDLDDLSSVKRITLEQKTDVEKGPYPVY